MKKQLSAFLVVILSFLSLGEVTAAKGGGASFTVSPYFTSHMVLQRDIAVPIWGTAAAGTPVTVAFNGQEVTAVTSSNGKWMVELIGMPASSQPETMVVSAGKSSISFTDVLIGDVWILSGQSNMNYLLANCDGGTDAVESSDDFPEIRLYMTWISGNGTTRTWLPSNSTNTPYWSGVGFFFARAMVRANGVPVGLIQVAKNGTAIASWTTYGGGNNGKLYKDNVMPIQPYAIRGVIWYQGEDDGSQLSTATQYYHMLPGLIANWRSDWGQGDFPFLYVQLAPIQGRPYWANIRDAQVCTLTTPNTAMACIIDVPTIPATAMHPTNKQPVGERLALAARALVDEQPLVYSGPIRDPGVSYALEDQVFIRFNHVAEAGGFLTTSGADPSPFTIAGTTGVYHPATAKVVDANTIAVSSPSVPNPKSVRYGWDSYPICNLFNGYSLPASPFQLDFE